MPPPFDAVLPRPAAPGADVHDAVARILRRSGTHGRRGARALHGGVRRGGRQPRPARPRRGSTAAAVPGRPDLLKALEVAFGRILAYHEHEGDGPGRPRARAASRCSHLTRPVGRAGLYAPGGRARYPSTVLMCAAPARVAGVASLALCVPPAADGTVDDATLCAARSRASTRSTASAGRRPSPPWRTAPRAIPAVDVIAGPGNAYVAEAKRQVSGVVGVAVGLRGTLRDRRRGRARGRPRPSPPSTWSSRPSTDPTGWRGS